MSSDNEEIKLDLGINSHTQVHLEPVSLNEINQKQLLPKQTKRKTMFKKYNLGPLKLRILQTENFVGYYFATPTHKEFKFTYKIPTKEEIKQWLKIFKTHK